VQTFFIGYISGVISSLSVYIFIQSVRGRKTGITETLEKRIDRNNSDIRRSNEQLRKNNTESGKIIDGAANTAQEGLDAIKNTRGSVSDIIAAAERKRLKSD